MGHDAHRGAAGTQRAQSIFELALLLGVVVTALLTIQTYARRSLQGRIVQAVRWQPRTPGGIPQPMQYEPYYTAAPNPQTVVSQTNVTANVFADYHASPSGFTGNMTSLTNRAVGAFQDEYQPPP